MWQYRQKKGNERKKARKVWKDFMKVVKKNMNDIRLFKRQNKKKRE